MGKLTYDSTLTADFEDRVLAHIQVVIGAKLRRGESFYFSWRDDPKSGDGRSAIWMHPSIPLAYKYFGSRSPRLNRDWIEALMVAANSSGGLQVVTEPRAMTLLPPEGENNHSPTGVQDKEDS
ncbi:ATP-dependent DNA ligase [Cryobacterium psychrophilum]|uniref:DUF7882 family protein n=1 Tax=Cryobacterium psychrophilum TaxID=41988 RepID=UPI0010CE81FA|nr:ATP-dependent DNA ligase [Cryobacterium psychrophilum]TDW30393.1 hypothetical protein EDD25_2145 [Cryobacterium psychrophilum]